VIRKAKPLEPLIFADNRGSKAGFWIIKRAIRVPQRKSAVSPFPFPLDSGDFQGFLKVHLK